MPDTKAAQIFTLMARQPRFDSVDGFELRPLRELDASNDSDLFTVGRDDPRQVPILSGSSINMWDPDAGDVYASAPHRALEAHLLAKARNGVNRKRSAFYGLDVNSKHDLPMHQARIAFKDVTSPTNTRSSIQCLIPPGVATVHSAPTLVRAAGDKSDEAFVLGVMSSIPFDWFVRRWVELHLTFEILNRMPVPRPDRSHPLRTRLVDLSGRLAAVDDRFQEWAAAVGVPLGTLRTEPDRSEAIAEIDALVSHLYGLSWGQVQHIFETFHRGWKYSERLAAVKRHYDQWKDAS